MAAQRYLEQPWDTFEQPWDTSEQPWDTSEQRRDSQRNPETPWSSTKTPQAWKNRFRGPDTRFYRQKTSQKACSAQPQESRGNPETPWSSTKTPLRNLMTPLRNPETPWSSFKVSRGCLRRLRHSRDTTDNINFTNKHFSLLNTLFLRSGTSETSETKKPWISRWLSCETHKL